MQKSITGLIEGGTDAGETGHSESIYNKVLHLRLRDIWRKKRKNVLSSKSKRTSNVVVRLCLLCLTGKWHHVLNNIVCQTIVKIDITWHTIEEGENSQETLLLDEEL